MGVKNFLIEGISGVGKTAVAEELERRGYHVVHGDRVLGYFGDPVAGEAFAKPVFRNEFEKADWTYRHWIWPVDIVRYLTGSQSHTVTFFCGASRNSHLFVDLFDKVLVLEVDLDTLKQRLAKRPEGEFGGKPVEKELIALLHATQVAVTKNAVRIDATGVVSDVVDRILAENEA
jgi:serine kinase of HPr protein (carbohydrate metabolism regulator)